MSQLVYGRYHDIDGKNSTSLTKLTPSTYNLPFFYEEKCFASKFRKAGSALALTGKRAQFPTLIGRKEFSPRKTDAIVGWKYDSYSLGGAEVWKLGGLICKASHASMQLLRGKHRKICKCQQ